MVLYSKWWCGNVCVCVRFCKRNLRWCFLLVSVLTPFAITRGKSFTSTVDNAVIPKLLHNILPQVSIDLARCSEGFCIDVCLRFQLIPSHSFHAFVALPWSHRKRETSVQQFVFLCLEREIHSRHSHAETFGLQDGMKVAVQVRALEFKLTHSYDLHHLNLFTNCSCISWYKFTGSWNWWISRAMFTRTMQVLDGKLIIHGYFEGRGAHKSEPLCPRFLKIKAYRFQKKKSFRICVWLLFVLMNRIWFNGAAIEYWWSLWNLLLWWSIWRHSMISTVMWALFVTAQLRIGSDAHSLNGWVWSKAPWYTRYEFP